MSSKEVKYPSMEIMNSNDGEYLLTYSQIFTLNRQMPKGWKIELFENMTKYESSLKPQPLIKRPRSSNIIKDFSDDEEESVKKKKGKKIDQDYISKDDSISSINNSSFKNNKRLREKKPNNIIRELDNLDTVKKNITIPINEINRKCERVFNRLKKHPLCGYFFNNNYEQFSLSGIEKKIKNNIYSSSFQFGMEVRAIWNYHFQNSTINSDIYQKTFTLSNFFEEIFKDIENALDDKRDIHELQKKVDKLEHGINTLNKNSAPTNSIKKERSLSISDKPMTTIEKTNLGNNIKKLKPELARGIINILSDSTNVETNSKYFEFDIETLPTKKLREIEKYVMNCLKSKPNITHPPNQQNGNFSNTKEIISKTNKNVSHINNTSENLNKQKTTQIQQTNTNNNHKSVTIGHSSNNLNSPPRLTNNTALKRPLKKPFDEEAPKDSIVNNDIEIEKEKNRIDSNRVEEIINKEVSQIVEVINDKTSDNTNYVNTSIPNNENICNKPMMKTTEIIQEETKDSNKKGDKSDYDSDSDSESGKSYLTADSESLSELDLSKKTTNKVN